MVDKIGGKKLGGVKGATETPGIDSAKAIGNVGAVRATSGVGGVKGTGAIGKRRGTRIMTMEERQQLLNMVNEEAEKIFGSGLLPESKKDVVTQAVRMAVDASIAGPEEAEEKEAGDKPEPSKP